MLAQQELRRPRAGLGGLEEAAAEEEEVVAAEVVPQGVLPDVHQAVPEAQARQVAHRAVPGPEAPLHLVAELAVHPQLAKSADPSD